MIASAPALAEAIATREQVLEAFVAMHGHGLARASHDMARAFARGGVLIPFGTGAAATDAAHVAVEFMHPVIVGKRALPALAPSNDPSGATSVDVIGRPGDIALSLAHAPGDRHADTFLASARRRGMLTIALQAGTAGTDTDADHVFGVASTDPVVVQEVQETAYHVLWELVHVFFEHPGLLDEACITCGDVAVEAVVVETEGPRALVEREGAREEIAVDLVEDVRPGDRLLCHAGVALERTGRGEPPVAEESTGFLYPFLASQERDVEAVLADARASTERKGADVIALRQALDLAAIAAAAREAREALDGGGRLFAFGNGGSATDAQDLAADALLRGWPAAALVNDAATVTALANDVGFETVFARQLAALGAARDVAVAISTSGSSPDVVAALEEAHRRRMLTVAITGYGGGSVAGAPFVDHHLVVPGDYVPRLQEAHATIYHLLLDVIGSPA